MTEIRKNASQASDQPVHECLKTVELACMDVVARISPGFENYDLKIQELAVRDSTMDQYGVGYKLQIAVGKTWKDTLLSRRNFGIDNFSTSMTMRQTADFRPSGHSVHPNSFIEIQCRAWHWKGDEEIVKKSLIDAVDFSIKMQLECLKSLSEKFGAEKLIAFPEPADMPKAKRKSSP